MQLSERTAGQSLSSPRRGQDLGGWEVQRVLKALGPHFKLQTLRAPYVPCVDHPCQDWGLKRNSIFPSRLEQRPRARSGSWHCFFKWMPAKVCSNPPGGKLLSVLTVQILSSPALYRPSFAVLAYQGLDVPCELLACTLLSPVMGMAMAMPSRHPFLESRALLSCLIISPRRSLV